MIGRLLIPLLLAALAGTALSQSPAPVVGYVASVRGRWTIDGTIVRPGDAHPVADGSVVAHAAGARDDRDSIVVRVGTRLVTRSCGKGECDAPMTIHPTSDDPGGASIVAQARETLRDPSLRALASGESVLSDEFRIVDGIIQPSGGGAELRPLIIGEVERGLVALACLRSDAECAPERAHALLCEISTSGCRLRVSAEGVYRIALFRRYAASGQLRYETTEGTPALVLVASGSRYEAARADWARVDAEVRTWRDPPRPGELLMLRRALMLRAERRG